MDSKRQMIISGGGMLIIAFLASILRYGVPPGEGWIKFLGSVIFFLGILFPFFFAMRYRAACTETSQKNDTASKIQG
jgi:Na+/melibiose symporter-like transporter